MQKRGKSLGAYQVCNINVYRDRQKGEGPPTKIHILYMFSLSYTTSIKKKFFFFCIVNVLNSKHTDQHCKKKSLKQSLSFEGPSPLSVYLGRHWCHACDKCSQVFCLHFCILQTIKNWEGLEMKLQDPHPGRFLWQHKTMLCPCFWNLICTYPLLFFWNQG